MLPKKCGHYPLLMWKRRWHQPCLVVASASGGIPEIVQDVLGVLVLPERLDQEFGSELVDLLECENLRRRMGRVGAVTGLYKSSAGSTRLTDGMKSYENWQRSDNGLFFRI